MVCFAGCSKENPHVEFIVKEMKVGPNETRQTIVIKANCTWIVTDEPNKTFTEIKRGTGTTETPFIVYRNPDVEQKIYSVTVTSEDGTSTDVLTIYQDEQFDLRIEVVETIAAEGGSINIPIHTNDEIISVDVPDWISFTSSRGLTEYTYTFNAKPNKTGNVRQSDITFHGKNMTEKINVTQDSFAPTAIIIEGLPEKTFKDTINATIRIEPAYADWSKLEIVPDRNCSVVLREGNIAISEMNSGFYDIKFMSEGSQIYEAVVNKFPKKLIFPLCNKERLVGQIFPIDLNYDTSEYTFTSSNPDVLSVPDKNQNKIIGKEVGWSTIYVMHEELNLKDSIEIYCDWISIDAEVSRIISSHDYHDI